ncbi:MAG: 3'-5' exonuclease, partial [Clostridium sp.]
NNMEINKFNLYKSYRSTKEIMDYSNTFLKNESIVPLVRSGDSVVESIAENTDSISDLLEKYVNEMRDKKLENIAIVTRDLEDAYKVNSAIKNKVTARVIDRENLHHSDAVMIIPSYFAKGLEFDGVIIVSNEKQCFTEEDKLMYVMCTRALHNLYVIKAKEL